MFKLFPIAPLGQNAVISMGQSPDSSTVKDLDAAGLPFLQGNAEFGKKHPSPKHSCINPPRIGVSGSTLISVRAPVGQTNIADRDYCIGRGLAAVKSNQYGPTLFRAIMAQQSVALKKASQGTTFEAIGRDDLFYLSIPQIPTEEVPLLEKILDTLDTQIQKTEALIAKLEKIKEGMLHDLLTRGIDENGQLRPTPKQAPELYKGSVLGLIPKEWEVRKLEDVASVERGQFTHRPRNDPRFYGGPYPFIQTGDVAKSRGKLVSSYSQTLSSKGLAASKRFPAGAIAVTIAANIADSAILAFPMYFPDSVVGIIPADGVNTRFIELCIRRSKPRLDARAPQSAQKNINLQDLRPLETPIPSQGEQKFIAEAYESLVQRIAREAQCLSKLVSKKTGLMDDLLTGKIRVTPLLKDAV